MRQVCRLSDEAPSKKIKQHEKKANCSQRAVDLDAQNPYSSPPPRTSTLPLLLSATLHLWLLCDFGAQFDCNRTLLWSQLTMLPHRDERYFGKSFQIPLSTCAKCGKCLRKNWENCTGKLSKNFYYKFNYISS